MTDTDDTDKKKIKIEEASEEIASQPNQTATVNEQGSPQNQQQNQSQSQNQATELISTESGHNSALANETDSGASVSLPTTVITTQRHRMITTTGQIR